MIILLGAAWPRVDGPTKKATYSRSAAGAFTGLHEFSTDCRVQRISDCHLEGAHADSDRGDPRWGSRGPRLRSFGKACPHGAKLSVDLECNPGQAVTKVDAMITERVARTTDVISFGPFTLVASERLLMKEGAPVELGSRTLDILIALVSRPNLTESNCLARFLSNHDAASRR
jgi:hypothetical protein